MLKHSISLPLLLLLPSLLWASESLPLVNHDLVVEIQPGANRITVEDLITLPHSVDAFTFSLNAALEPKLLSDGAQLQLLDRFSGVVPGKLYQVSFKQPRTTLKLSYAGLIQNQVTSGERNPAGSRPLGTPGDISDNGVFLSASALWYPVVRGRMLSFTMRVSLPEGWRSVSQGVQLDDGRGWQENYPQDDIYLIAGRYTQYRKAESLPEPQVYLWSPDPELAQRYLKTTDYYVDLYQQLIGLYPYQKFAMVENFWESGYGMPSFTLLGPRVLRFPFILHSSYPHEILHNWWGNGVYVDYRQGNWSEGLTSYLADHLIKEQRGEGASYRRDTLQRYADFVRDKNDFPLAQFRGRHGDVSQAVGYGKALMFYHMLRLQLGDRAFIDGLRSFYRKNLHRIASFDDLRSAFETSGQKHLEPFFEQWINSTGAPDLHISEVELYREAENYHVRGVLQQRQTGQVFDISVPIAIQTDAQYAAIFQQPMNSRIQRFDIALKQRPYRLVVDPQFDLFRRLAKGETPSSLSQLFGAERVTVILPSAVSDQMKKVLQRIAEAWAGYWDEVTMVWDDALDALPDKGGVILIGITNRFSAQFFELLGGQRAKLTEQQLIIADKSTETDNLSFALTAPHPVDNDSAIGLFSIGSIPASGGFARKLPHYGKYSYALFRGDEPDNILKGQWDAYGSTLSVEFVTQPLPPLQIPPHTPLIESANL